MDIPGAKLVTDVFGHWPSFHDAEVVRLELLRAIPFADGPDLRADIHAFEITDQVAPGGHFVLRHHVEVSFRFRGVDEVRLEDWNNQNVLFGLSITDIGDRQLDRLKYEVSFDGSFGVHSTFLCRGAEVESVKPWEADGEKDTE